MFDHVFCMANLVSLRKLLIAGSFVIAKASCEEEILWENLLFEEAKSLSGVLTKW